ncbi:MAG: RHS repeat-associated core domain-containing protein [Flavobacterium sp.]|nr:RHS repeat-associated core domain-containing protein [Flavobacterium sp.]
MKQYILKVCVLLSAIIMLHCSLYADPITYKQVLGGQSTPLTIGAVMPNVIIPDYNDANTIAKEYSIKNLITLKVDEQFGNLITTDFKVTVKFNIHYTTAVDNIDRVLNDKTLTVDYKKGAGTKFTSLDHFSFGSAKKIWLVVTDINTYGGDWSKIAPFINLTAAITPQRDYKFLCTSEVATVNKAPVAAVYDECKISWTDANGVKPSYYDIEWAWVEKEELQLISDASLIFKNNATRVSLNPENVGTKEYTIPTLYDGEGFIFYRIRPVQLKQTGEVVNGQWSTDGLNINQIKQQIASTQAGKQPAGNFFIHSGHEDKLNWQSTTSFAEEGKRKTVIQYFDGSLRLRQTVTKDNQTQKTVVAETFYDYQGRATIEVLPAPTLQNVIKYVQQLNQFEDNASTATYPKELYDGFVSPATLCTKGAPKLQNISGASNYYSSQNPETNLANSVSRFIPDAGGYPYTETRYTPDNTGRIAAKSGVGASHQLGSNHETKYYYGSASQRELDALFGGEAGDASHYFKNMVRDANGQYSVSYVDMHGRTVATALAGKNPTNLNVLPSYATLPVDKISKDLLNNDANIINGKAIETNTALLVPKIDNYDFVYQLSPRDLALLNCKYNTTDIYNATYDLEITITNACGDIIYTKNETNKSSFNISFTLPQLAEGEYNISKRLSINEQKQVDYRTNIFLPNNTCKSLANFTNEFYAVVLSQNPNCKPTCQSCSTFLGSLQQFKTKYLEAAGYAIGAAVSDEMNAAISKSYYEAKAKCDALCDPAAQFNKLNEIRASMLEDMMPSSGQYANLYTPTSLYNIFSPQSTAPYIIPYKYPYTTNGGTGGIYASRLGVKDATVYNGTDVTNPQTFSTNFDAKWAQQLLPYHPEYCKLNIAEAVLKSSYDLDARMEATDKYTDAVTKGYISNNILDNDPFFSGSGIAYKAQMDAKLNKYVRFTHRIFILNIEVFTLTMWQTAYVAVFCKNVPETNRAACASAAPQYPSNFPPLSSCGADWDYFWRSFRSMYLTEKERLVNQYLSDQCPTVSNTTLVNNGFRVYFDSNPAKISDAGDGTGASMPTDKNSADEAIQKQYEANCRSNTTRWTNILLSCPQIAGIANVTTKQALIHDIIEGFVGICKSGCTVTNPIGASTLPNGNSFQSVLANTLSAYGLAANEFCNGYLFDWPKPYDKQVALSNKVIIDPPKPESCECVRLSQINQEYRGSQSLSSYLFKRYNTTISQATLDILLASCAGNNNCNFLAEPISLPPVLQCNVNKSVCISCIEYNVYKTAFQTEFAQSSYAQAPYKNFDADAEPSKLAANQFFAQYMNFKTGFSKDWADYLAFDISCNGDGSGNTYATASESPQTNMSITYDKKLCGSGVVFGPVTPVTKNPCDDLQKLAVYAGYEQYELNKQNLIDNFDKKYIEKCLEAKNAEVFTVSHTVAEYHYTLYYYDQAGNLVKTVAPEGVRPNYSASYLNAVASDRKNNTNYAAPPAHVMATQYRYNSLNQVVAQITPDGGESHFWFDRLGRLVASQNAKQKPLNRYSYTVHDALGRVKEVGEKALGSNSPMSQTISRNQTALNNWINGGGTPREQITRTIYDYAHSALCNAGSTSSIGNVLCQQNLRNRVSYSMVINSESGAIPDLTTSGWASATFYSYDVHGNVDVLLHSYRQGAMAAHNEFKKVTYSYDLISGKVNSIAYQPNQPDAFYHQYAYDGENKVIKVYTSKDSLVWERDATYDFYRHGSLARMELGDNRVQGIDYAYTIQGWLKGVNTTGVSTYDMGKDGLIPSQGGSGAAKDAYGYSLNYFAGDYTTINTTVTPFATIATQRIVDNTLGYNINAGGDLYNGNIAAMLVNIPKLGAANVYNYAFDQLNRIVGMDAYNGLNTTNNSFTPAYIQDYKERISYDANGNILHYLRNGTTQGGRPLAMDQMHYSYIPNTNQLDHITDDVNGTATNNYTVDIDDQVIGNYHYDAIGNLTYDDKEGISNITWTVYGKIKTITKTNGTIVNYTYDATGNRISKKLTNPSGTTKETDYVRDAVGNVLSIYTKENTADLYQTEVDIYGTNRLGVYNVNINVDNVVNNATAMPGADGDKGYAYKFERGNKFFELTNHLGNVLVTVTDRLLQVPLSTNATLLGSYEADVATATDYYPFGMAMPGRNGKTVTGGGWASGTTKVNGVSISETLTLDTRTNNTPTEYKAATSIEFIDGFTSGSEDEFTAFIADASNTSISTNGNASGSSLDSYRYGFNGKENDKDISEGGQDYGMRIYDSRVGRFLSVDPIAKEYPELTPYQFASNTPIWAIDIDGLEGGIASPMGGQNVVDAQTAKDYNAGKSWFSQPASRWMKLGLAAQMNAIQPTEVYNENSYPNMTKGQYVVASMLQSNINNSRSSQSFSSRSTRLPQQPHAEAEVNVAKPKLNTSTFEDVPVKTNTTINKPEPPTLQQKKKTSIASEAIVRARLNTQLAQDEILMEKPRFYINGGKNYTTPDFAIYNTKTNSFVRIPDAKNGDGGLTKPQSILNEKGGEFRGSSRYPQAKPQSIAPGMVKEEKTTLPYHN